MPNTCLTPQVSSFDTSKSKLQLLAPQLPLPDELVTKAMETALVEGKQQLNKVLEDNSFCIPSAVSQYLVPPPQVTLYPQEDGHGYLEFVSYCDGPAGHLRCAPSVSVSEEVSTVLPSTSPTPSSGHEDLFTLYSRCSAEVEKLHECTSSTNSLCKASISRAAAQCDQYSAVAGTSGVAVSIDSSSTYVHDGQEYLYGAYVLSRSSTCSYPCCPTAGMVTYFKNGACKDSVRRSCHDGFYVEEQFADRNCSKGASTNRTMAADSCLVGTEVPVNASFNYSTSMMAVCPKVKQRSPSKPSEKHYFVDVVIWMSCCFISVCIVLVGYKYWAHVKTLCASANQFVGARVSSADAMCAQTKEACVAGYAHFRECSAPLLSWCTQRGRTIWLYTHAGATRVWQQLLQLWGTFVLMWQFLLSMRPRSHHNYSRHDMVDICINAAAALGFAIHGLLWRSKDPFEAFDDNVFKKIGLANADSLAQNTTGGAYIDAAPVQRHFRQWSLWGQRAQLASFISICFAILASTIEQIRPFHRSTISTFCLGVVVATQTAVILIPAFFFALSLSIHEPAADEDSTLSDPEFRSQASAILSLAFDGVALTFISTLFVFLMHGIAPGIFLGSCAFASYLTSMHRRATEPSSSELQSIRSGAFGAGSTSSLRLSQPILSQSWTDQTTLSQRSSFTGGVTIGSIRSWKEPTELLDANHLRMSPKLLLQQHPRLRIINWIAMLGAPCGNCLPIIIVYQSLGASIPWAILWPICWVIPMAFMYLLIQALNSRSDFTIYRCSFGSSTRIACIFVSYIIVYGWCTLSILNGLVDVALAGGFTEFTVQFPLSTFISMVIGTMALANSYFKLSLFADARRQHMARPLLRASATADSENISADESALDVTDSSQDSHSIRSCFETSLVAVRRCMSLTQAKGCLDRLPRAQAIWYWLCEKDEKSVR